MEFWIIYGSGVVLWLVWLWVANRAGFYRWTISPIIALLFMLNYFILVYGLFCVITQGSYSPLKLFPFSLLFSLLGLGMLCGMFVLDRWFFIKLTHIASKRKSKKTR